MSCFFCDSLFHLSQNCDKHVTLESRLKLTESRNYCSLCLHPLNNSHSLWSCDIYKCCFQCFSTEHHTYFCPDDTGNQWCIPKIDENLFPRLLQFFDPVEYFPLAFSSPITSIQTLPLRVMEEIKFTKDHFPKIPTTANYVVSDKIIVNRYSESSNVPAISTIFPKIVNKAKIISLKDSNLSSTSFFVLLTPLIKEFECCYVQVEPKIITFSQILAAIPNVQIINLKFTNCVIENSWPEDMLNLKSQKTFSSLKIGITDLMFNAETLANFMKNAKQDVKITLHINSLTPMHIIEDILTKRLSTHFSLLDARNIDVQPPLLIIKILFHTLRFKLLY